MKPKVNFFYDISSSELRESDAYSEDEPLAKQSKHDIAASNRLNKLDSLNWKLDHGPQVNQNLAKSLNRGIANVFCMCSLLGFADNYKPPDK